jgi:hypothetical protein
VNLSALVVLCEPVGVVPTADYQVIKVAARVCQDLVVARCYWLLRGKRYWPRPNESLAIWPELERRGDGNNFYNR